MNEQRSSTSRYDESSAVDSDDPRLVAAVREYMAALEKGAAPSRQEFLDRHREIAGDLAVCLDGLEMVHSAAVKVRRQPPPARPILAAVGPSQPLGDFQIVREIGRGGMGVVYEALQLSLGRRVALKVLPFAASLDPARLERFRNEAQAAAQLHHTNIVPIYSVGIDRGVHFYAMQLIEGQALSSSIAEMRRATGRIGGLDPEETEPGAARARRSRSNSAANSRSTKSFSPSADAAIDSFLSNLTSSSGPPPVIAAHVETGVPHSTQLSSERSSPKAYCRTVARLMQQAALALQHAHMMGVVHRDIKPGNLLLDKRNDLWVTDFGLAQFHTDAELTRTGDLLGTLRYMSPEQASGGRVVLDHRTDIYSLGATMYEVLTLEPIFAGDDRNTLLRRIVEDDPRAPRTLDRNIPLELETIVLKATAKSPADRYATAQLLADDLQRWLDDKPIMARRPALAERVRRWSRRHKTVVRAAGVVFLLGVVGLAAHAILMDREHSITLAALNSERQQHQAADASFAQARDAIDGFTQLSEDEFGSRPSMQSVRRKFLEKSYDFYSAFLKQRANDPTQSKQLAAAREKIRAIVENLKFQDQIAPLMLLADANVQDELNIPEDQRDGMESLLQQVCDEQKQAESGDGATTESGQASVTESLQLHGKALLHLLSTAQRNRLQQIAWQEQGVTAFRSPDIISKLNLTSAERKQIDEIIEQHWPSGPPEARLDRQLAEGPPDRPPGPRDDKDSLDGRGPRDGRPPRDGHGPGFDEPPPRRPGHTPNRGPDDQSSFDPTDQHPGPEDRRLDGRPSDGPLGFGDFDHRDGGPEERHRHDEAMQQILALLTPEQRTIWSSLIGEPFEVRHRGNRHEPDRRSSD